MTSSAPAAMALVAATRKTAARATRLRGMSVILKSRWMCKRTDAKKFHENLSGRRHGRLTAAPALYGAAHAQVGSGLLAGRGTGWRTDVDHAFLHHEDRMLDR